MKKCHKCGKQWISDKRQPAFKEYCDACAAYLHCCLNCRFYDPHAHNKCYIPTTEWVADRAGTNFCDEFEFAGSETHAPCGEKITQARDAFQGLFGDAETEEPGKGLDDFKKLFEE
jgi:hypothetical protein